MSDDDADQAPSAERPSWRLVDSSPICSAAFLLGTSWIRHVDGGRSLQYNDVFCGAHVGSHAADGDNRFVIIGFDHDDVLRSGECAFVSLLLSSGQFGSRFSCFSLVMRGSHVELWIGLFFDVWPWVFRGFSLGWMVGCFVRFGH